MTEFAVPILHMASFARSGETIMLRALDAHPRICIVHQLTEEQPKEDMRQFEFMSTWAPKEILNTHPMVVHKQVNPGDRFVLKNGVWTHAYPFDGFVLVRNPFSVVASMLAFAEAHNESEQFQRERLSRWTRRIDPALEFGMADEPIWAATAMLYARRMLPLASMALPIVRYEDFVVDAEAVLIGLCPDLGIEFDPKMPHAHQRYLPGAMGHGGCALWKPISSAGASRGPYSLPPGSFDRIHQICASACDAFGYEVDAAQQSWRAA